MGNLGGYQTMTTVVKSLGGPVKALTMGAVVVSVGGYGVGRLAEAGSKRLMRAYKKTLTSRRASSPVIGQLFTVHSQGVTDKGLDFQIGSEFVVLELDGDAIIIEVLGRKDNPHVVSGEFLASISNFAFEERFGNDREGTT